MTPLINTLSERSQTVEESITMKISALAKSMKAAGKDVIDFGAGEPDFDTPEAIKAAGIDAIKSGKNKYTPATGINELKDAVIHRLKVDQNLDYAPNEIIISCGAKHSVYNVFMAVVNPGDEVIIPSPFWVSYPEQVRLNDGVPVIIDCPDTQSFKLTPQQLEAAITPKTKCLVLNTPSNPTGMVYTRSELEALAKVILKHKIWVLSDEIYEKLIYGSSQHVSFASLSQACKDCTIVINGVAKAYSMTGWRIGYLAAPAAVAKAIGNMQSHMTSNPTTNAQWASVEAFNGDQTVVEDMRKVFAIRRDIMVSALNKIPHINSLNPEGAFYAFPNISGTFGKTTAQGGHIDSSLTFCEHLLKEQGIACVPGSGFGADEYMRLSYATSEAIIIEGIRRIHEFVKGLH